MTWSALRIRWSEAPLSAWALRVETAAAVDTSQHVVARSAPRAITKAIRQRVGSMRSMGIHGLFGDA
jgi:hypothetical protein